MAKRFKPRDDQFEDSTLDPDDRELAFLRTTKKQPEPDLSSAWRDAIAADFDDDDDAIPGPVKTLSAAEENRLMSEGYASDLTDDAPARPAKKNAKGPNF